MRRCFCVLQFNARAKGRRGSPSPRSLARISWSFGIPKIFASSSRSSSSTTRTIGEVARDGGGYHQAERFQVLHRQRRHLHRRVRRGSRWFPPIGGQKVQLPHAQAAFGGSRQLRKRSERGDTAHPRGGDGRDDPARRARAHRPHRVDPHGHDGRDERAAGARGRSIRARGHRGVR